MYLQRQTPRDTAMAKQNSQGTGRLRPQNQSQKSGRYIASFICASHQPPQQGFAKIRRISTVYGIAPEEKTVGIAGHESMQKKTAVTLSQHDLTRANLFQGAALDFDHGAWPKSREHALSVRPQTQPPAPMQNLRSQGRALCAPTRARRTYKLFRHQEVFCEN
jgi:hypothetical protein